MRMRTGKYNACFAPFGYQLVGGKLELILEQAPIIRYIYDAYLAGKTAEDIAATLNLFSDDRPWKPQRIDYILTNERYSGNALLRKRYTTDTIPRKVKRNRGERPMCFVAGINEAVVSQEIFDKAQELRKKRWENRLVDPDIFISRQNELAEQLRAAKLEKERFLKAEEDQTIQQTQELIEALEAGPDFLDAFDGELFRELVDKIIVESNDRVQVRRQERTTPCKKSPAQKELRKLCGGSPPAWVERQVLGLLNRLIQHPERITCPVLEDEPPPEVKKLRRGLDELLHRPPVDEVQTRDLAFRLADLQLNAIGPEEYETLRLRRLFQGWAPMAELEQELLHQSVRRIAVSNGTVTVLLKNNQTLVTLLIQSEMGLPDFDTAEDVKKYPLAKVESLFHIRHENGTVEFFQQPLDPNLFAKVVILKEGKLLPLEGDWSMEKIRLIRQQAKQKVFVTNAIRALTRVSPTGNVRDIQFVVLVGGSALDFEVPQMVTDALSQYKVVAGRGNIRGTEGPRNAVATGLVLSLTEGRG